jgi:hypothetical protein
MVVLQFERVIVYTVLCLNKSLVASYMQLLACSICASVFIAGDATAVYS